MRYYVYLVKCSDGSYYCGYTTNLKKRVDDHNNSKAGAKYTKSRRPVKLVYFEQVKNTSEALKREDEIKKLSRKDKVKLVAIQK
ncbi:hypothetical protein A3H26_00965 [candidate division WWE3 bacterium RIFCSPLOWO2_12_FULL_36_10]|uniref:GIY-YIG domain-containing protein n=1 Tax=candidate division WWE3 bacterium RIFCSPLOWO2_12_FULL_36_10 TaxID=1802630 RepID=A0A1F4VGU3_UNCKA|nr:MAG: hypothetical protein A3H26_00965 [candidate division WWE3 bacterium RIFCSPLOWO2_12_FULL_36_10]